MSKAKNHKKKSSKTKTIISILIVVLVVAFILFNIFQQTKYYNQIKTEDQNYLRTLALEITKNQTDDMGKLIHLMNWIYENIEQREPEGETTYTYSHQPREIIEREWGLCFDKSYVFELMSQSLGYEVRHVSLTMKDGSHAISEVKVDSKWVVFDQTNNDVYYDEQSKTYLSIKEVFENKEIHSKSNIKQYDSIIYGVNSFHGNFAEPRIPYPDINLKQFAYNIGIINYLPFSYKKVHASLTVLSYIIATIISIIIIFQSFNLKTKKRRS